MWILSLGASVLHQIGNQTGSCADLKTTMSTLHVMAEMRTHTSRAVLLQLNNMTHLCALVGILTVNMINFYFVQRSNAFNHVPDKLEPHCCTITSFCLTNITVYRLYYINTCIRREFKLSLTH